MDETVRCLFYYGLDSLRCCYGRISLRQQVFHPELTERADGQNRGIHAGEKDSATNKLVV